MTFIQLKHFSSVYKNKSITGAAKELYTSQPTVTTSIKKLEQELEVNLLKRVGGKIIPTEEGHFFYAKSQIILDNYDKLIEEMSVLINKRKHLKIGVPFHVNLVILPIIFKEFHEKYPDVQIEIVEKGGLELIQSLLNEEIQILITAVDKQYEDLLNIKHLFKTNICFCVSKEHELAKQKTITFERAFKETLIMFTGNSYKTRIIKEKAKELNIKPKILFTTNQIASLKKSIANNFACGFMIDVSIEKEDNIVKIPLEEPVCIQINIITKKGVQLYSHVKSAYSFIVEKYK